MQAEKHAKFLACFFVFHPHTRARTCYTIYIAQMRTNMTALQIKRVLQNAGIAKTNLLLSRDEVEVFVPDANEPLIADDDATEELKNKVQNVLPWGGFRSGYGSWFLQRGYQSKGDPNDVSSRHHY